MIDSHCHLADEAFVGDLDGAIDRAREAGLTSALCILAAGDEEEASRARGVARDVSKRRHRDGVSQLEIVAASSGIFVVSIRLLASFRT